MWDGTINEGHLYASFRLTVHMYESDGSDSKTVGSGTGFVIRSRLPTGGRKGYLVTNRHVLDPSFAKPTGRGIDKVEVIGFAQVGDARPIRFTIQSPQPEFADGGADVAVIDLERATIPGGCPELTEMSNLRLANASDFQERLHVGAQVLMPGYPSIDGVAAERPILVSGTVASDPREMAEIGRERFPNCVLCHSFSWGGMSGSPVFALLPKESLTWGDLEHGVSRELYLVGINRGHLRIGGMAEGALTYFVKTPLLAALLRRIGAKGLLRNQHDDDPADDGRPELIHQEVELDPEDPDAPASHGFVG
ncbi:serine protease [Streptomyces sp. NPDC052107]|uniref:S1 family peptidase n=1 Tax=Streptomyces sp. NPDC052107 TaxID=3155632 RepID=UPI00342B6D95